MKVRELLERVLDNWPAKVLSVAAAILLLVFNRMNNIQERSIEIPLEVILADGFAIAAPYQEKVSITVRGENEEAIESIQAGDFRVYADLSEIHQDGEFPVNVRYTRKGSALSAGTFVDQVEPSEVRILIEEEVVRTLDVQPDIRGSPADGYTLARYELNPAKIDVVGPRSKVDGMEKIVTQEIDVTGKNEDFTVRKELLVDDSLVSLRGSRSVEFRAFIAEVIVTRLFVDVAIEGANMNPALVWQGEQPDGKITLVGPQLLMDALTQKDIVMSVNLADLEAPGAYRLKVRPSVPPRMQVRDYEPEEITVRLGIRIPEELQ